MGLTVSHLNAKAKNAMIHTHLVFWGKTKGSVPMVAQEPI